MSEFNFKSQICTTREQSERLLALGLKKETADMYYRFYNENTFEINPTWETIWEYRNDYKKFIPAWTLHRLLMMIDSDIQTDGRYVSLPDYGFVKNDNIYDNLCDCIEWLIKKGYFPKEYLV